MGNQIQSIFPKHFLYISKFNSEKVPISEKKKKTRKNGNPYSIGCGKSVFELNANFFK